MCLQSGLGRLSRIDPGLGDPGQGPREHRRVREVGARQLVDLLDSTTVQLHLEIDNKGTPNTTPSENVFIASLRGWRG